MKSLLLLLIFTEVLVESWAYTRCSYTYYTSYKRQKITTYYSCSSNQYCCGNRNCCTAVYTRWYLWFVITMVFFIVFLVWWYYRFRYRPRHMVVAAAPAPAPATVTTINTYPTAAPVTVIPNTGTVHYTSYPYASPNSYPVGGAAPPPYSSVAGARYPYH